MFIKINFKKLLTLLTILGTVSSIIISIWALNLSHKSIGEAKKANSIAEKTQEIAIIENRPVLNIEAIRFKENGSFILAEEKNNALEITLQFEISNTGGITAEDMRFPSMAMLSNLKDNSVNPIPMEGRLDTQDLAPGNKEIFELVGRFEWPTDNAIKIQNFLKDINNNQCPFLIELPISYLNTIDKSQETKIDSRFNFYKDTVYREKFDIIFPDSKI